MKHKSVLNKTIDFNEEQYPQYLQRCLRDCEGTDFSADSISNQIIIGDTFNVLPKLPKGIFPLIIADPPYNISKQYSTSKFKAESRADYKKYTEHWLSLVLPLLADNGSMYICVDWKSSIIVGDILSSLDEQGHIFLRNRITWEREKGRGAKMNWKNCLEDIWFFTKSRQYTFNTDAVKMRRKVVAPYTVDGKPKDWTRDQDGAWRDTYPSNFWSDITVPFWSMPENTAHPAQKSEKLLAKLILCSSNNGDIVFDPFGGSGSTAVTAKKLGRRWCSIEKESRYCAWAQYRLEKADYDKSIQGFKDGVFHLRND